jgi:predicted helicase
MANFLKTYQVYKNTFSKVWLWHDFPFRKQISLKDVGIDLVAKTFEGTYWAVQCKCVEEDTHIVKSKLDSFLSTSGKQFTDDSGARMSFSTRLLITTSYSWSSTADSIIQNQAIECKRLTLAELETAPVIWDNLDKGLIGDKARTPKKELMEHQRAALEDCVEYFKENDRGKLIMACGTGKTFTSLRIAERQTNGKGLVLFLAPSIALIGQTLREWAGDAKNPPYFICVCSDSDISVATKDDDTDLTSTTDLALPATTDPAIIAKRLKFADQMFQNSLHVIFSTYQSIDRVAIALETTNKTVDLIICDEAHRTTGVIFNDQNGAESAFVKVHDDKFIKAKKRLYMTATPKVYGTKAKDKAAEYSAELCSMDDIDRYGQVIHALGFGKSVDLGLLSDYRVLVLTVNRNIISAEAQKELAIDEKEISSTKLVRKLTGETKKIRVDGDLIIKLIGCLHALSKNTDFEGPALKESDPGPMRRAVAFCQTISLSKYATQLLKKLMSNNSELELDNGLKLIETEAKHIDGTMGTTARDELMAWLKNDSGNDNSCRILSNVRCLSEGVDVPTLDAVMFLSGKNSQIEVIQSVGRVMRKAPGKRFGYVILPVIVPTYEDPEKVLDNHEKFKVVWDVLNALKAHDDRFQAMINRINFNEPSPTGFEDGCLGRVGEGERVIVDSVSNCGIDKIDLLKELREKDTLLHNAIFARLVTKFGSRQDMAKWAADVATIADGFINRITEVVNKKGPHKDEFDRFLAGLRQTLNPSVDAPEAIEMLAQHLITKPVFEALFDNYSFVKNNPVSHSLETMIDILEDQGLEKDKVVLSRFYETVKAQVEGINNAAAKQRIIVQLYDTFFKLAMPKAVEKLGIVYTPIEIVDFIINSVAEVLKSEFKRDISDENVHILDPFTGTGTFITRLIQSGLLGPSLGRKYRSEIHANEITLLAYYIASINIENAFHDAIGHSKYQQFEGICFTDTFQLYKNRTDLFEDHRLQRNFKRVKTQINSPITIIIGNPPYSAGQGDANKNAKNQSYPELEEEIAKTYAYHSGAANKNSLYDSYVKAFLWASRRIPKDGQGVIAYVSNAGWIDGNAMDGMRKCLAEEFSKIYVFNLRGNQRTSGELSKKEGGKIFGSGSRTPVAITILVKNPEHQGPAEILYHDIGDYLTREQKLAIVAECHDIYGRGLNWQKIEPNEAGDWINQRSVSFKDYIPLGIKGAKISQSKLFFNLYSRGLETARDAWCYNYCKNELQTNIINSINFYNKECKNFSKLTFNDKFQNPEKYINLDPTLISWSSTLINKIKSSKYIDYSANIIVSIYRPFSKQFLYFDDQINNRVSQFPKIFPTQKHQNLVICVSGVGVKKDFSTLITDIIPDLELAGKSQCFPRYYYEEDIKKKATLFKSQNIVDGYVRHDAITDYILKKNQSKYSTKVTKDDIFYYVYGLLHSEDYRKTFSADLKKMLPRLPLVEKAADFWAFSKAGRDLAELHLNYETVKPYSKATVTGTDKCDFKVDKIRFISKDDKSAIQYNHAIRISGIPLEAYDYVVNGRSPIEWVLYRYQVKTDQDSGLKNDPNAWAVERDQPRYILDLILSLITVSLETLKIVKDLPRLNF